MSLRKMIVGAFALLATSGAMAAEQYFDFSFNAGPTDKGNLALGGVAVGAGEFDINSVTGTIDGGEHVTLLPATSPVGSFNGQPLYEYPSSVGGVSWEYNNLLYTTGALPFDYYGLGLLTAGGNAVNLFSTGGVMVYSDNLLLSANGVTNAANLPLNSFSVAAVPEPSTLTMLLAGMFAFAFTTWRRPALRRIRATR